MRERVHPYGMGGDFQKGIDDAAKSQRTLIDHSSLANPLVLGTRSTYILRTRKVDKVEFKFSA